MAAPTISAYSNSDPTDTGATETTGSVSWNSGDLVVVLGITEDNARTLTTPTSTGVGLTFSALTGFPTNIGSSCKLYAWSATAAATSSGTISSIGALGPANGSVIGAFVLAGHGGLGNTAKSAAVDTTDPYTVSLPRSGANSVVLMAAGDWNAVSDTTTDPSPLTGSTQRLGDNAGWRSGEYNAYLASWADEGAAGTTSYGIAGVTGGQFTVAAVEVLGTASTDTQEWRGCYPPPRRQTVNITY